MDPTDIQKYISVMKEIKLRIEVINLFLSGRLNAHYEPPTIESIGLQFRKIFELVAFGSLAANRREYSSIYSDFEKHWEAARLVKNLRKFNPNFYPRPVVEVPSDDPRAVHALNNRGPDYLTEDELVQAHGRCGALMHAANPFATPIDYSFFQRSFPIWLTRLMNLLNNHQIHLLGDPGFYLIHMKEERDDEVHWYRFQPPESPATPTAQR